MTVWTEVNTHFTPDIQNAIRDAVKPGDAWALDELRKEVCTSDQEREALSEIVAEEYRRRLDAMQREEMLEVYRRHYQNATDANKDWLLGEIVESIEAERN